MKYIYVRPMKRRPKARLLRSDAKFIATVAGVALAAFVGTMIWPRGGEVETAQAAAPSYDFACDVAYVNDGDTLRCEDGTRVRIHAIAARESDNTCSPGHPCPTASADESKAALERLAGDRITCIQTGTSYKRVADVASTLFRASQGRWPPGFRRCVCGSVDERNRSCRSDGLILLSRGRRTQEIGR